MAPLPRSLSMMSVMKLGATTRSRRCAAAVIGVVLLVGVDDMLLLGCSPGEDWREVGWLSCAARQPARPPATNHHPTAGSGPGKPLSPQYHQCHEDVTYREREQSAVDAVEHTTMTRQEVACVFDAGPTLEQRFEKVAELSRARHQQAEQDDLVDPHLEPCEAARQQRCHAHDHEGQHDAA